MTATEAIDPKPNRRAAFRIYEQSNLFYRKLDRRQANSAELDFDDILESFIRPQAVTTSLEASLPPSQSQENDTLNVNISASGIAFTCREQLEAGDYLMLRILLLSNMTVVMACCQVVYCKPSNPYEPDRYPCSIGARFVNMRPADTELLNEYVAKKRKQQWIIDGSLAALVAAVLAAPDQALALLSGLIHHLFEIVLHLLHLGFEYLEMGLDHVIEHLFHTGRHETQIIVFYVLVTLGLIAVYLIGRKIPAACKRWSNNLRLFWTRKYSSALYFWNQQSLLDKIKIVGIAVTAISAYLYFGL